MSKLLAIDKMLQPSCLGNGDKLCLSHSFAGANEPQHRISSTKGNGGAPHTAQRPLMSIAVSMQAALSLAWPSFACDGPAGRRSRARSGSRAALPAVGGSKLVGHCSLPPAGCKGHKHDETVEALRAATTRTRPEWREPAGDVLGQLKKPPCGSLFPWSKVCTAVERRSNVGGERASSCAQMCPSIVSSTRYGRKSELPCLKRP